MACRQQGHRTTAPFADFLLQPPADQELLDAHERLMGEAARMQSHPLELVRCLWEAALEEFPESLLAQMARGSAEDLTRFAALVTAKWPRAGPHLQALADLERTLSDRAHSRSAPQWLPNCRETSDFFLARGNLRVAASTGNPRQVMINNLMTSGVLFLPNRDELLLGSELLLSPARGAGRALENMRRAVRDAMPMLEASTHDELLEAAALLCEGCQAKSLFPLSQCWLCRRYVCDSCADSECRFCALLASAFGAWSNSGPNC